MPAEEQAQQVAEEAPATTAPETPDQMGLRMLAENVGISLDDPQQQPETPSPQSPKDDEEPEHETPGPTDQAEEPTAADETTGGKPEETDDDAWRQDSSVIEFAESVGLTPDALEEFDTQRELERYVHLMDRSYIAHRRQVAQQQQAAGPQRNGPPPTSTPAEVPQQRQAPPSGLPELDAEMIDEPILKAIQARDDFYRGRIDQLENTLGGVLQHFQQQAVDRELAAFNDVLDSVGDKKLFGTSKDRRPGTVQHRNYQRALDAYSYLPSRQPTATMVRRAIHSEFHSELKDAALREQQQKIRKQSKRVLHGGPAVKPSRDAEDEVVPSGLSEAKEKKLVQMGYEMMLGRLR